MLRKLYAEVPSWACAESAVAKDIAIHMYVIRRLVMKFCAGVQWWLCKVSHNYVNYNINGKSVAVLWDARQDNGRRMFLTAAIIL